MAVGLMKAGVLGAEAIRYVIPISYARPLLDQASVLYQDNAVVPSTSAPVNISALIGSQISQVKKSLIGQIFPVSETKFDSGSFTPSSQAYTKTIKAPPGSLFLGAQLVTRSQNNASDVEVKVAPDGKNVQLKYRLTSGDSGDRGTGWLDADLITTLATISSKAAKK